MDFIWIGRIVDTHGIKGEVRIISDFEYKNIVFQEGFNLYIGEEKKKEVIASYRHHKNFEMVTFPEYNNINEVLKYLKKDVYIVREDLQLRKDEYLDDDLIGMDVFDDGKELGKIVEIFKSSPTNKLIKVNHQNKFIYIPFQATFILNIDLQNRKMEVKLIKGMI